MKEYRTILILLLMCHSCIVPFDFKTDADDLQILVVDGNVNNVPDSSFVRLSFAAPYSNTATYNTDPVPAEGALVYLIDDLGGVFYFEEELSGRYIPSDPLFAARETRSYQLHIELADGRTFESDMEMMPEGVKISDIEWVYENRDTDEKDLAPFEREGYQVYVLPEIKPGNQYYLKYGMSETWEITHWGYEWYGYYIVHRDAYDKGPFPAWPFDENVPEVCWRTYTPVRYLNICSVDKNYGEETFLQPLTFISLLNSRLKRRYSVNITQTSLSKSSWTYWDNVRQQQNYTGSIYDPLPFKIPSNIYNINDPDEQVAGYFTLGNVVTRRFFIEQEDLGPRANYRSDCIGYNIYADDPWGTIPGHYGWPDLFADNSPCCFECDLCKGIESSKPDFW